MTWVQAWETPSQLTNSGAPLLKLQTEPISNISEFCSSNELFALKFGVLPADSDADGAINIQNLLQNKFCAKSGIIFAVPPCNELVFKNLNNIVNGSAWTIMLSTKFSELILYVFQSFTSLVNAFNCINYNSSKAIKQPAYPETFFFSFADC